MVRISVIGGGSTFVPSILHGVDRVGEELKESDETVEVSLYDIVPPKAETMARYGRLLSEKRGVPLATEVAGTRDECLKDADIVLLSITFANSNYFAQKTEMISGLSPRWISHGHYEFGPTEIAIAARGCPFMNKLGQDISRISSKAILLNLVNPTDLLANLVEKSAGVRAFGLCVEVEHLRDHLAYYFDYEPEQISMIHAGVNHDGWVLRLTVAGEDGYKVLHDKILSLPGRLDFHPYNQGMVSLYRLTGYLRSSAYHFGLWEAKPSRNLMVRELFYGRNSRASHYSAVESALAASCPIQERYPKVHPELSDIRYLGTGIAIARLARSMATGRSDVFALQTENRNAITNFPEGVYAEVPVIYNEASRERLCPMKIDEFPEWLAWTSKQLAVKRKLAADYILTHDIDLLKRSLLTVPQAVPVDDLMDYAETLHKAITARKDDWELSP